MDLAKGFTLEDPLVTIRFGMSERELQQLLGERLRHITDGYYCLSCTSLGGLQHELGCHFKGGLNELEFFRKAYPDQVASFNEFQRHFEAVFGPPAETTPGSEGLPNHRWTLSGFEIIHVVYDRFGPEEHMRIRSTSSWPSDRRDNQPMQWSAAADIVSIIRRLLGRGSGR
jgi:hypothetical protein